MTPCRHFMTLESLQQSRYNCHRTPISRLNSRLNPDLGFNPLPRCGDYRITVAVFYSGLYRVWLHSQLNQPPLPLRQTVRRSTGSRVTWTRTPQDRRRGDLFREHRWHTSLLPLSRLPCIGWETSLWARQPRRSHPEPSFFELLHCGYHNWCASPSSPGISLVAMSFATLSYVPCMETNGEVLGAPVDGIFQGHNT